MIDPLSLLAQGVITFIIPKALEKMGEMVGETAFLKSKETISATRDAVQKKLKSTNTDGILTMAEADPSEGNLQVLETVLLTQMKTDEVFASQLRALFEEIQAQSPSSQVILDTIRVRGSVEVGNVEQIGDKSGGEQVFGRNIVAGENFKVGDITQKI
jgi:hypothetical protein